MINLARIVFIIFILVHPSGGTSIKFCKLSSKYAAVVAAAAAAAAANDYALSKRNYGCSVKF